MRLIQMYLSDLKELLAAKEFVSVRTALKEISPVDVVDGWDHFSREERGVLFRLMPRQRALQLFEELEPEDQVELLGVLKEADVEELVRDLDPAETSRVMRGLPKPMVRQLEAILRKGGASSRAAQVAAYPDKSVGSLMRTRFHTVLPRWTCREALTRVSAGTRLRFIENTYLDTLIVVDPQERFLGTVTLKELVVAPADMPVSELMRSQVQVFVPEMDQERGARLFHHYRLDCAAVLDRDRKVLGVVLDSDMDEVTAEETEEDIAKMAGTTAEDLDATSAVQSVRNRLPWLAITCVGQLLVSTVIHNFEATLSRLVALATFMPLIAAMGGNVGSQSAIMVVRSLASGAIAPHDRSRTVLRDMRVGLMLGLVYSALMVGAAHAFYGGRFGWDFSLVIGLGTLTSMSIAATLGALVPFVFQRFSIDPATATGPLVTTLTDLISTASYLAFASVLLMR
jgi:magnesium transporter